ncbi:MAG: hypothetical protein WD114_04090 [Phycisphaerales bacterium]
MTLTRTNANFTQTSHTLIHALRDERTAEAAAAELMQIYWPAVYAFLRRRGQSRDSAAETTQAFFVCKLVEGDLFHRFDASRGRLRSLILRSLKNYAIDEHRGRERARHDALPDLPLTQEHEQHMHGRTPEESFEQRWAVAQLEEAVRRCRAYFVNGAKESHWKAFEDRVYAPAVYGAEPTPMDELSTRLGFKNAATTAAAVQLVRRRVVVFLREIVNDTVSDPGFAEEEFDRAVDALRPRQ